MNHQCTTNCKHGAMLAPNLAWRQTDREYLIWKLLRDWPALRYWANGKRKLNRLSTKQLLAKEKQLERINRKLLMRSTGHVMPRDWVVD